VKEITNSAQCLAPWPWLTPMAVGVRHGNDIKIVAKSQHQAVFSRECAIDLSFPFPMSEGRPAGTPILPSG